MSLERRVVAIQRPSSWLTRRPEYAPADPSMLLQQGQGFFFSCAPLHPTYQDAKIPGPPGHSAPSLPPELSNVTLCAWRHGYALMPNRHSINSRVHGTSSKQIKDLLAHARAAVGGVKPPGCGGGLISYRVAVSPPANSYRSSRSS